METFASYHTALVAVAGVALITLAQSAHVNVVRARNKLAPDAALPSDYADPVFRVVRTFLNSTESLPTFAAAVFAAVLLGAAPFWINLLAALHLLFRLAYWPIYVSGVGAPAAGLRSFTWAAGWTVNVAIAVIAIVAGLT
jgi:uncharacterized MAPEG superfamily protein